MLKWIAHIDWQGKCKQRGASPGNNDFGDSSLSLSPLPVDLSALDWEAVKGRWVWRGPDGHLPGKVSSEVVGGEGQGRVATSWGRSRPGSPPRFPSRAGDAGRGRGRGGEGRERGRRGERRNLPPLAASLSAPGLGTKGGTLMNSLSAPLPWTRGYLPLATLPPRLSPLSGHTQVSERLEDRDKGSVSSKCDQVGKKVSGDCGLIYLSLPRDAPGFPALGRTEEPSGGEVWLSCISFPLTPGSLLFCSLRNLHRLFYLFISHRQEPGGHFSQVPLYMRSWGNGGRVSRGGHCLAYLPAAHRPEGSMPRWLGLCWVSSPPQL